jgi:hypothetical protein
MPQLSVLVRLPQFSTEHIQTGQPLTFTGGGVQADGMAQVEG